MPPTIAALLARDMALLGPLTSTLGLEDMYDLLEVARVEEHNTALIEEKRRRDRDR